MSNGRTRICVQEFKSAGSAPLDVRELLVDLPPSAARAAEEFASAGLENRASTVAGSFFDLFPLAQTRSSSLSVRSVPTPG